MGPKNLYTLARANAILAAEGSLMQQAQRSRTAEIPAIMRALHQTADGDPKILADPIAPRLLDPDDDRQWLAPMLNHPFAKQLRAGFVLRSRYAEDCLAEAAQRGIEQYLVLGAGLDTFAYRQPPWSRALRIFEVDHPVTQDWKLGRLRAANIEVPSNLTFVPIDFEKGSLADGLKVSSFAFSAPTFCSCLGVTQHLTTDAIDATLRFILSLPRSSEIVFSFVVPQEDLSGLESELVALAARRSAEVGERWLTRLRAGQFAAKLRALGFTRMAHLTPDETRERYFSDRRDGLKERLGEQLMRAVV
jgi:methyltransferase (TIGR00027 family)